MITKEQCRTLNVGDCLLFFNTWRKIEAISQHPRGNIIYFKFIKIKGKGYTLYTNHNLRYKVKTAFKLKTQWINSCITYLIGLKELKTGIFDGMENSN